MVVLFWEAVEPLKQKAWSEEKGHLGWALGVEPDQFLTLIFDCWSTDRSPAPAASDRSRPRQEIFLHVKQTAMSAPS